MKIFIGNFYLDALAIIITLLAILVRYLKRSFTFWKRRGVYTLPPSIPFGNATNLVFQTESISTEIKKNYDEFKKKGLKYGGFYFCGKPIFIPVDLDLIKLIMTKDFAHFTDRILYVDGEAEPLTAHLIFLKGLKWKRLRSKLNPSFSSGKIKMMFQTLVDCTKELIVVIDDAVKKDEAIDTKEVISRFTTDVIGSCAFGIECNSLKDPDAEFRKYGKKFFEASSWDRILKTMSFMTPEILHYLKFRTVNKDVTDFFMNVVKETVNYREKNRIVRNDLLHLLIQLKNDANVNETDVKNLNDATRANRDSDVSTNPPETSLTLEEITAQCFGFFVAGFETSATATTFFLYELGKNLQLQDKLRKEINTVLTKHEGKITYDAVMEMVYLDKCVNETLRKYPPVHVHTRECTQTYKIPNSDVVIEKGSIVFIPAFGIHRDPELYPDPDKFDPERFSEEVKASRHPSSWIPFGDGPRICIGLRLGMMLVKVGLVALLKNFKFTVNSRTQSPLVIDPKMPFILTPKGSIWHNAEKCV